MSILLLLAFWTLTLYSNPSTGLDCGARDSCTLFSIAAARPSTVCVCGSIAQGGSFALLFRSKFLSADVMAAAGPVPAGSSFWAGCRVLDHFNSITVTGEPSCGGSGF